MYTVDMMYIVDVLMMKGVPAIKEALGDFDKSREIDIVNEKRPTSPMPVTRTGSNERILRIQAEKKKQSISQQESK